MLCPTVPLEARIGLRRLHQMYQEETVIASDNEAAAFRTMKIANLSVTQLYCVTSAAMRVEQITGVRMYRMDSAREARNRRYALLILTQDLETTTIALSGFRQKLEANEVFKEYSMELKPAWHILVRSYKKDLRQCWPYVQG